MRLTVCEIPNAGDAKDGIFSGRHQKGQREWLEREADIEATAAVVVFENFFKARGSAGLKTGNAGGNLRMSERQRVHGTAAVSCFCESRGNLVSKTVMPPNICY